MNPSVPTIMASAWVKRSVRVGPRRGAREASASATSAPRRFWRSGGASELRPIERSPEFAPFYEKVLFERNERMAARLAQLALDGRVRLVVVGAGHMLGARGIPALLAKRGFEIRKTRSR